MDNIAGITIVAAHNQNIDISGITFKNQNGNHYVEVNGSKNVNIHETKYKFFYYLCRIFHIRCKFSIAE